MISYPTNIREEAVEASLSSARQAVGAILDQVDRAEEADRAEVGSLAEQLAWSVDQVVARAGRLDRASPYRLAALEEAEGLVAQIVSAVEGTSLEGAVGLEMERASLVTALAKMRVGDVIKTSREERRMSAHALARRASMAPSYLNELEAGRSGLPSDEVCAKLSKALGVDLATAVREARQQAKAFRERARARRVRERRSTRRISLIPHGGARVQQAVVRLAEDPQLLELVEGTARLPAEGRRAVLRLVQDLETAFGASAAQPS